MIHLFWGEDAFGQEQAEAKLTAELVDAGWAAMNLNLLEGEAAQPSAALSAARTPPFGPGARLVVVRGCTWFSGGLPEGEEQALEEAFARGLPEGSHLLLRVAGAVDRRGKLGKKALETCKSREFTVARKDTVGWVVAQAREQGARQGQRVRFSDEAAHELVARVGHDRQLLSQEVAKLLTYAGDQPIDTATVRLLSPPGEGDVFQIVDHVMKRRAADAVAQTNRLLDAEPALKVVAAMGTVFRRYLNTRRCRDLGMSVAAIAEATRGKHWLVRRDVEAVTSWSRPQLERAIALLAETDLTLKTRGSGKPAERLALELLIARLLV